MQGKNYLSRSCKKQISLQDLARNKFPCKILQVIAFLQGSCKILARNAFSFNQGVQLVNSFKSISKVSFYLSPLQLVFSTPREFSCSDFGPLVAFLAMPYSIVSKTCFLLTKYVLQSAQTAIVDTKKKHKGSMRVLSYSIYSIPVGFAAHTKRACAHVSVMPQKGQNWKFLQ